MKFEGEYINSKCQDCFLPGLLYPEMRHVPSITKDTYSEMDQAKGEMKSLFQGY